MSDLSAGPSNQVGGPPDLTRPSPNLVSHDCGPSPQLGAACVLDMEDNRTILQPPTTSGDKEAARKQPKSFTYDYCSNSLDPKDPNFSSQAQDVVFDCLGKDILENAFKGCNACIFAYGQTGSGKSYKMMGSQGQAGNIPRLCNNLFERIETMSSPENQTKVEVSYMEIYNEKVFDLLDLTSTTKAGLKVREHNVLGPYVDGLGQLAVISFQVTSMRLRSPIRGY